MASLRFIRDELIAIIDMDGENAVVEKEATPVAVPEAETPKSVEFEKTPEAVSDKFYSPLVKSIAKQENITVKEPIRIRRQKSQVRIGD